MDFNGILLVDKPVDWTSFDVVAKIRGTLKASTGKKIKVGHTGTLDPLASGLMIIAIGSYCKRAPEFSGLDKTYLTDIKLGYNSSTGDEEGEKTAVSSKQPSESAILAVLKGFEGEISQTPPIYSAVKINGQRAYKLARKGVEAKLEPRKVTIKQLKLTKYDYPIISLEIEVSSGTYIRSLAADIGEKLGTGAYITSLRRTTVGDYKIENALTPPKELTGEQIYNSLLTV